MIGKSLCHLRSDLAKYWGLRWIREISLVIGIGQACNITDSEYDDAIEEEDDELDLDGQAKPSLIDIEEILALEANKFDRTPLIYL